MSLTSSANAPSVDVKDMLVAGFPLVFGTDLFVSTIPQNPNNIVCVFDSGGQGQERYGFEKPNVQIWARNVDYATGYALMRDIKYYLDEARNGEIWNGTKYIQIAVRSDILPLGQDELNRYLWTLNFQIYRSGI